VTFPAGLLVNAMNRAIMQESLKARDRNWRRSHKLVSEIARECAPGPQGRLNRPPSTISPGVGLTEEAHRRAMNRSGGLQRPTSANAPRPAPTAPSPPEGPIKGGVEGPIKGGSRDPWRDPTRELPRCQESRWGGQKRVRNCTRQIARRGGLWGLNRPRRDRDPAPGPTDARGQACSSSAADPGQRGQLVAT
jgi:hypothetical protein